MNRIVKQLVILFAVPFFSCGGNEKEAAQQPKPVVIKVSVREVQPTGQTENLSYSGTIEAENTVSLGFSVPGRVTAVNVIEGQPVRAGQLLATVETAEYSNALMIANAGYGQAKDMYDRLNALYKKGSLPAKDFVDIQTKLAQAQANKSMAAKRVADTRLYSPMTGIIVSKLVEKGTTASPGVPVFNIMKTDVVYATASITESEIGKLKRGGKATVFVPTLDRNFVGNIAVINPKADVTTRTFNAKVRLSNTGAQLLPGMIAEIKIGTGKTVDAITVPAESIVRDAEDITYVFVVDAQNKAKRKRINAGALLGNEIVVTDGLKQGDKIVIAGQTRLKDGASVII